MDITGLGDTSEGPFSGVGEEHTGPVSFDEASSGWVLE